MQLLKAPGICSWYLLRFEFRSCECLFQALDSSMHCNGWDIHIVKCLYILNHCCWRLFHWFATTSGICWKNLYHFDQNLGVHGSMALPVGKILIMLCMQAFHLILVIVDPWCSCCSACFVLQRKKHYQKAIQTVHNALWAYAVCHWFTLHAVIVQF